MKTRGKLKATNGVLYWHIVNATKSMTTYHQIITFTKAFAYWGQFLHPIRFESTADPKQAHIRIHFVEDGHTALHGHMWGTVAGFAYYPDSPKRGEIYLNEHRDWSETNRFYTIKHEIGHSLGLTHSEDINDLMFAKNKNRGYGITEPTIKALKENYGILDDYTTMLRSKLTEGQVRKMNEQSITLLSTLLGVPDDKEEVVKRLFKKKTSI